MPRRAQRHASFQELLTQLRDADYRVRRRAVRALAKAYGSQAAPALIDALATDMHCEVRLEAVHVLSDLKETRPVDALIARLGDSSRRVRELAAGT
jgi:HEAT repeat protein